MKKIISEKEMLRNYWLVEAMSDEVESAEKSNAERERAKALDLIRMSFDYNCRHYFDSFGDRPMSEFSLKLFSFTLAEWRKEGKIW